MYLFACRIVSIARKHIETLPSRYRGADVGSDEAAINWHSALRGGFLSPE